MIQRKRNVKYKKVPIHNYPKARQKLKPIKNNRNCLDIHSKPITIAYENKDLSTKYKIMEDSIIDSMLNKAGIKKSKMKWYTKAILILVLLLLSVICYTAYLFLNYQNIENAIKWDSNTTVEYGEKMESCFTLSENAKLIHYDMLDTSKTGTQTISITYSMNGEKRTQRKNYTVVDTQKPVITIENNKISTTLGESINYKAFGIQAKDPVDGNVSYSISEFNPNQLGKQKLTVTATDMNNLTSKKYVYVNVKGQGDKQTHKEYEENVASMKKSYQKKKQEEEEKKKEEEEAKAKQEAEEAKKKEEEEKEKQDEQKNKIMELVSQINSLNPNDYTESSWNILQEYVKKYNDASSLEDKYNALNTGINQLVKDQNDTNNETPSDSTSDTDQ